MDAGGTFMVCSFLLLFLLLRAAPGRCSLGAWGVGGRSCILWAVGVAVYVCIKRIAYNVLFRTEPVPKPSTKPRCARDARALARLHAPWSIRSRRVHTHLCAPTHTSYSSMCRCNICAPRFPRLWVSSGAGLN